MPLIVKYECTLHHKLCIRSHQKTCRVTYIIFQIEKVKIKLKYYVSNTDYSYWQIK